MNRFLTRKKTRDEQDEGSGGRDVGKKGKKGKKGQPEQVSSLDLTLALPSEDNFRTSLIMPTLSTRFSMLREQDDPKSKLGKASDDSVLAPKRQSRLHEYGFRPGALGDIAEVSSINGSISARFGERQGSIDVSPMETALDNGSIMSRARPGEGNVLFGGRQKIYMVTGSGTGSTKSLGKALYDDDVDLSAYQKYRKQEKERAGFNDAEESQGDLFRSATTRNPPQSPAESEYSQRRETTSSDTSGVPGARTSTAATSVTSQTSSSMYNSPAPSSATTATSSSSFSHQLPNSHAAPPTERTVPKTRRLYEQGLNQQIHDQQHSALNRLNHIQKAHPMNGRATPPLFQAKSTPSLNERFNRQGNAFRTASPTPSPFTNAAALGSSKDLISPSGASPVHAYQSPPMSPDGNETEEQNALQSAISPNDRGKATALGAFNKPKQYDENQYVQRLQNLQQGRETPPLRRDPSNPPQGVQSSTNASRKNSAASMKQQSPPRIRARAPSNSSALTTGPSGYSVFQRAANLMRSVNGESGELTSPTGKSDNMMTFFASPNDSEDEVDRKARGPMKNADISRRLETIRRASPSPNRPAPPLHEHPALRSTTSLNQVSQPEQIPEVEVSPGAVELTEEQQKRFEDEDVDSPTLGTDEGGLSGLVRQHLRNVSNVSSVYTEAPAPPEPLAVKTRGLNGKIGSGTDTPAHSSYSHSNPWDLEDFDGGYYGEADSLSSASPIDPVKPRIRQSNDEQSAPSNGASRTNSDLRDQTPKAFAHWEKEMMKQHTRNESTDTQRERDAITREMHRRRQAIEEKLSASKDDDSQSESQNSAFGARRALTMLRSKPSRDSVLGGLKQQPPQQHHEPTKALKMLGLGIASKPEASSQPPAPGDSPRRKEMSQGPGRTDQVRARKLQGRPGYERAKPLQGEQHQRSSVEENDNATRSPPQGRSPPSSSKSSTRNRSSSDVSSGRSLSRPGRYRDDLDKAMAEGTGNSTSMHKDRAPMVPQHILEAASRPTTVHATPAGAATAEQQSRGRSNSKSQGPGYFDQKGLLAIHTNHQMPMGGSSPHLSPGAPAAFSPAFPPSPRPSPGPSSPGMFQPRPSPMAAYSANSTPPISNPTTPVPGSGFPGGISNVKSAGSDRTASATTNRKKSINKSDISEPILLSKTSNVDVVDLPPGASLKNGVEVPPPLPPINPLRRRFGLGKGADGSENPQSGVASPYSGPPQPPYLAQRTHSGDELDKKPPRELRKLRKTSSEGHSLRAPGSNQGASVSTPALQQHTFGSLSPSPPQPTAEGVMF